MNAPKDPTSLVGLLKCKDGTAAVYGIPHRLVEADLLTPQPLRARATVRLTREAGEALYELLGDWLGKRQEGHGELVYDGPEDLEDEGYSYDPAELQRQAEGK